MCEHDTPVAERVNRLVSADLWPGADLAINLICGLIIWVAGAISEIKPGTALILTLLAAIPSINGYIVKRNRDNYNKRSWWGAFLHILNLLRIILAMGCLFVVGFSFAVNRL
ncbi:MAG: hypothetical protein PGN33_10255 [Methylobacterium radiotolerans]